MFGFIYRKKSGKLHCYNCLTNITSQFGQNGHKTGFSKATHSYKSQVLTTFWLINSCMCTNAKSVIYWSLVHKYTNSIHVVGKAVLFKHTCMSKTHSKSLITEADMALLTAV